MVGPVCIAFALQTDLALQAAAEGPKVGPQQFDQLSSNLKRVIVYSSFMRDAIIGYVPPMLKRRLIKEVSQQCVRAPLDRRSVGCTGGK